MNVAITRAREGLIIVGDHELCMAAYCTIFFYSIACSYTLMFNLGSVCFINTGNRTLLEYDNDTWEPLIELYKEKKCVVKASAFPHRKSACAHFFVYVAA